MNNKNKSNNWFRIEVFAILGFFLLFMMWSISKCKKTKAEFAEKELSEIEQGSADSLASNDQPNDEGIIPSTSIIDKNVKPDPTTTKAPAATTPKPQASVEPPSRFSGEGGKAKLYVVINQLNLRTSPGLNATLIAKLNLFDEVLFTGEVTDTTSKINLGGVMANEPWIRVQTSNGKIGWVYGAGVSYYKKKKM
ncbi:MAG: SH3 domain-containing protein [Saprospiraceae bacterium]|nr:SH3 domain-containing protein [Saprospiraceae bacterium]